MLVATGTHVRSRDVLVATGTHVRSSGVLVAAGTHVEGQSSAQAGFLPLIIVYSPGAFNTKCEPVQAQCTAWETTFRFPLSMLRFCIR